MLAAGIRKYSRNRLSVCAMVLFTVIVLGCIVLPEMYAVEYYDLDLENVRQLPSWEHPFGTDLLGRDVLLRMFLGGRTTLGIMAVSTLLAAVVGGTLGIVAGYYGGKADFVIMRAMDIVASVPSLLLAIVVEVSFGFGSGNFKYGLAVASMPAFAVMARTSVMEIVGSEYVKAARTLGASDKRVIFTHILRNIAPTMFIQLFGSAAENLLNCTFMGYMEIGVTPPTIEWGAIAYNMKDFVRGQPVMALIPCAVIVLTEMALIFIGNGMRDAFSAES